MWAWDIIYTQKKGCVGMGYNIHTEEGVWAWDIIYTQKRGCVGMGYNIHTEEGVWAWDIIYTQKRGNLIIFLYNLPPILCTKPASVNILFPHIDRTNKLITDIIIANVNKSPARAKNITAAFQACGKSSFSPIKSVTKFAQVSRSEIE